MAPNDVKTLADLLEVMKENPRHMYDFISENSYRMEKAELVDIIKELLYSIHSFCDESQAAEMLSMAADELEYQYKEDLENIF